MKRTEEIRILLQREQLVDLPIESEILSIVLKKDVLKLYALVDTKEKKMSLRKITMVQTGERLSKGYDYNYITTLEYPISVYESGMLHFYEVLT